MLSTILGFLSHAWDVVKAFEYLKYLKYIPEGFYAALHWSASLAWWHPFAFVMLVWVFLVTFYVLYIAAINVYENRHDVPMVVLVILSPLLITMLVTDFVAQMTIFSVIFWDRPRNLLVTARLKDYRATGTGWRKHWADEICMRGLNPFAPSKNHC